MKIKKIIKDYFSFTRKERIAVLILLPVLVITIFIPSVFYKQAEPPQLNHDKEWINAINSLELKSNSSENVGDENNPAYYQYERSTDKTEKYTRNGLFPFNPNILPAEDWKRLGLRDKTIKTIQKYLQKGGRFKKPEDLQRIYGLSKNDFERLYPFINIPVTNDYKPDYATKNFEEYPKKINKISNIEINNADTSAFIALPGIGSKLAARIINFREKLGGFYSVEQIGETYGVPDSTYQKIKPFLQIRNEAIKKFNLNTATKDELKMHPYIKWNLANAIVEYRNQHGPFNSLEELKKINIITDDVFEKIKHYVVVE